MPAREPHRQAATMRMRAVLSSVSLLAVACAGSSASGLPTEAATTIAFATNEAESSPTPVLTAEPPATPTSAPDPTVIPTPVSDPLLNPPVFDEALLMTVADEIDVQDGTFLFAVIDEEDRTTQAGNGTDTSGEPPTANAIYQIGSFTKVFTALAALTLVDQGRVDLDAPAAEYVSRIAVPADVTVRDLLQHTSGIYDYAASPQFVPAVFEGPSRLWTPEELHDELVGARPTWFAPGASFSYSNTNYLILGVLLEEVTGQLYHQVVREQIIDPLSMTSTYLAGFEEGPLSFDPYEHEGAADYDITSQATSAWSAGAMASSASDLHLLFGALFNNEIISEGLVAQMTEGVELGSGVSHYGLGLDLGHSPDGFYGHSGGFLGYVVLIHHAPEPGVTAFLAATDSRLFGPPGPYSRIDVSRFAAMNAALGELTTS